MRFLEQIREKGKIRVLIADDMMSMRQTLRAMLAELGYHNTIEAPNGLITWEKLQLNKVDLAILDWNMPGLSGIEVLRKARANDRFADIPFIIVTAEVAEETIAEAAETEVDAYIIKPFIAQTLGEKIDRVLVRKKNPSPVDVLIRSARVRAAAGEYNKAMEDLKTAMNMNPRNPRILNEFGDIYFQRGMLEDSEKAYKKAILCEPRFTRAYDGLTRIYAKKGDNEKLMRTLQEGVRVSPKNANRQTLMGKAMLAAGDVKDARKAFDAAVKAEPGNPVVRQNIAEVLLENGMDDEAAEMFEASLKINPENVHVYNRLGIAYRKQGKCFEAIEAYQKALGIDPEDEHLHYNLGRAYLEGGMKDSAVPCFEKALELYPEFREARQILEIIFDSDS